MKLENQIKYKTFRNLCLRNAEDFLKTSESMIGKNINHIAYHLSILCLEEIGKIFIGWYQLDSSENSKDERLNIPMDDHIKKLFWAIWGPSIGDAKITKDQIDENKNMATSFHTRRLDSLYTDLTDKVPSASKISDDEFESLLNFTRARFELSKVEGEIEIGEETMTNPNIEWFVKATNIPEKRTFIFGNKSQDKLVEFGDINNWILWLKEYFENQEKSLKELIQKELAREIPTSEHAISPKWKIKFKVVSPSHSIRQNIFNSFNQRYGFINLGKGGDNHTLLIEMTFGDDISITNLWNHGLNFSKLFVAALNVATNGIFYWSIAVDSEKYYDKIWDIENKKELSARLGNKFKLNWEEKRLVLIEEHLHLTYIVFEYFSSINQESNFQPIAKYLNGLAMLSKTDIHLGLERESFIFFYDAFVSALKQNEIIEPQKAIKEIGYEQIDGIIKIRTQFDKVMDLGERLFQNEAEFLEPITLTEAIGMKQYVGIYLLTIAVRKLNKDNSTKITNGDKEILKTE